MSKTKTADLKIYEIINRTTGEKSFQAATTAEDACKLAGWLIGDCFINEPKPRYQSVEKGEPLLLVRIPCKVCTYQWAECIAPAEAECPCRSTSPDLNEWLKQVTTAHLCDYVGCVLSRTDHHKGQKWLPMDKAIEELGDHH